MSSDEPFTFMPPDEPTAVYPIGQAQKPKIEPPPEPEPEPVPEHVEPPEPPSLAPRPSDQGGFNPAIAVAAVVLPILLGIAALAFVAAVLSFS